LDTKQQQKDALGISLSLFTEIERKRRYMF
jgi:hypothetical protein